MKNKKSNISFSLLSLSIFLFFTFTFSSHVFSLPSSNQQSIEVNTHNKYSKVRSEKNDANAIAFIGEVEEVEEDETKEHLVDYHLPAIFSFYTSHFHTQKTNNSLLTYSHLKSSLCSTPVFIKNCTFLI